jgi:branched-chain amino acid transport system permease protein
MDVVVSALNLAAIYGLVAIGLSLTWAGLNFLNLAHGTTFAFAGFGALLVAENVSEATPVILLTGLVVGGLAGAVIWAVVFLPLDGRPNWDVRSITATLALSLIGGALLLELFGPDSRALPVLFGSGGFHLGDTVVTAD